MELTTPSGYKFKSYACVVIDGKEYDLDEMNEEQTLFTAGALRERELNAAFRGEAKIIAQGLPTLKEAFP